MAFINASGQNQINFKFRIGDHPSRFTTLPMKGATDAEVLAVVGGLQTYTNAAITSVTKLLAKNDMQIPSDAIGNKRPHTAVYHIMSADGNNLQVVRLSIPEFTGGATAFDTWENSNLRSKLRAFAADDVVVRIS